MPGQHAPNKRIVSLRIDKTIADRFYAHARAQGLTPTALITRYITRCAYREPKKSQGV